MKTETHCLPTVISEALPTLKDLRSRFADIPEFTGARYVIGLCNLLIAKYLDAGGHSHGDESVADDIAEAAEVLLRYQAPDGTINSVNLQSPPDTGFVVQAASRGLRALKNSHHTHESIERAIRSLRAFLDSAREPIRTGGVHTPNHRWVVSAALALLHEEFGDTRLLERMNEWLAEGIDLDTDGQFCERSSAIYTRVSVESLLEVAITTGRHDLLAPVRQALDAALHLVHPDNRIETVASRRQDQFTTDLRISSYYFDYRYMAILDGNAEYAAMASKIEALDSQASVRDVIRFFAFPESFATLPASTEIPTHYRTFFAESSLYRVRNGSTSISVFAGSDNKPDAAIDGMVSGRATSPTIVTFAYGSAACRWVRIAPYFFGVGYLRPSIIHQDEQRVILEDIRSVGYVQPLPPEKRSESGAYSLTTSDERYWAAAALDSREVSELKTLKCTITVDMNEDSCSIHVNTECSGITPMWFEIACTPDAAIRELPESSGVDQVVESGTAGGERGYGLSLPSGAAAEISATDDTVEVRFAAERPTLWVPERAQLGNVDSLRLHKEREQHSSLHLLHAAFTVPGQATLTLKGRSSRNR